MKRLSGGQREADGCGCAKLSRAADGVALWLLEYFANQSLHPPRREMRVEQFRLLIVGTAAQVLRSPHRRPLPQYCVAAAVSTRWLAPVEDRNQLPLPAGKI